MADLGYVASRRLSVVADRYLHAIGRRLVLFAVAGLAGLAAGVFALVALATALAQALGAVAACLILALLLALVAMTIVVLLRRPRSGRIVGVPPRPAAPGGLAAILAGSLAREMLVRRVGLRLLTPTIAALGAGLLVARLQSRRRPRP